jgi:3-phenylpropionate/trans-cinnamate dioxygenase ferredoxin subunit
MSHDSSEPTSGTNLGFDAPEDGVPRAVDLAFAHVEKARPPKARRGRACVVCTAAELPPGQRRIVETEAGSIGVFNLDGRYYALANRCPHAGAELCRGTLHATHRLDRPETFRPVLHGRVLRCPWHGWEFDLPTGQGLHARNCRVRTFPVAVNEAGEVVLSL